MNIFFLSWDPQQCASWYGDQHVIKILIEIVQMLYTAHWLLLEDASSYVWKSIEGVPSGVTVRHPYLKTHVNHPMCKWVRQCSANYNWATRLALAIAAEYTRRFDKTHKSEYNALWLQQNLPADIMKQEEITTPPICAIGYEDVEDVISAYRQYYTAEKLGMLRYTHSTPPKFTAKKKRMK